MTKFDTLWKGKWVSVISPENAPYECLHEKDVVLIIPIREVDKEGYSHQEIGIRLEDCPPYLVKDQSSSKKFYTVISGKIDGEETAKEAALRELKEEAGVVYKEGNIYKVFASLPLCKSTDLRATMLIVECDEFEEVTAKGDGTEHEKNSKTIWVSVNELHGILEKPNIDVLLYAVSKIVIPRMHDKNGRIYGFEKVAVLGKEEFGSYRVGLRKDYFPGELKPKEVGTLYIDLLDVEANSRTDAAHKAWEQLRPKWRNKMLPSVKAISLYVNAPNSKSTLSRLEPIKVEGSLEKEAWDTSAGIENGDIVTDNAGDKYELVNVGEGQWYNEAGEETVFNEDPEMCQGRNVKNDDLVLLHKTAITKVRMSSMEKISSLGDGLYKIGDNDIPVDEKEMKAIAALNKESNEAVVVDMYEVDYDPNHNSDEEILSQVNFEKDLVSETVMQDTNVNDVNIPVAQLQVTSVKLGWRDVLLKRGWMENAGKVLFKYYWLINGRGEMLPQKGKVMLDMSSLRGFEESFENEWDEGPGTNVPGEINKVYKVLKAGKIYTGLDSGGDGFYSIGPDTMDMKFIKLQAVEMLNNLNSDLDDDDGWR